MILLVLLSCGPGDEGPATKAVFQDLPEIGDWSTWTGTYVYTVQGAGADEPGCELHFDFVGQATENLCEDCEYAFDLDFTYDADASVNTWRCVDPSDADFSWTLGYDADFYGYPMGAIWYYHEYGAYWTQSFYSQLDGDTLSFGYEVETSAYYYEYYLYSYEGSGTLD